MSSRSRLDVLLLEYNDRLAAGQPCALEDLCAETPELIEPLRQRLRDVESLFAFLEKGARKTTLPNERLPARSLPSFSGYGGFSQLGPYRLLGLLGSGGMGLVLRGEDSVLQRPVAIKVMRPEVAAVSEARDRFLREARLVAQLNHPHVVTVHHVGEHESVPFLVMPLLEGESLAERLERVGQLCLEEAVRIAQETAEGLAAAHARGLIHRDIKPANIWLEGPQATVKVLDFGLARRGSEPGMTPAGMVLGTPAYMAPEQARSVEVDARCDLFSLGSVLYEMCTGAVPFPGKDVMSILYAVVNDEPVPVRQLRPEVPEALGELITQLMRKDREGRPASACEVTDALRTMSASQIALAARGSPERANASPGATARGPWRRRSVVAGVGALVLVCAVCLAGWLRTRSEPTNRPENTEAAPRSGGEGATGLGAGRVMEFPGGPTEVLEPYAGLPRERNKVHILEVFDTSDPKLKDTLEIDEARLDKLWADTIPLDMRTVTVLKGDKVTADKILGHYRLLQVGPDEGLLFFYGGHGATDPMSQEHYLDLRNGIPLLRSTLRKAMLEKNAGLTVLLTDCQSSPYAIFSRKPKPTGVADQDVELKRIPSDPPDGSCRHDIELAFVTELRPTMRCLLFRSRGVADITAATDNAAWSDRAEGGLFTRTVAKLMNADGSESKSPKIADWGDFSRKVQTSTEKLFQEWREEVRVKRGIEIVDHKQVPRVFHKTWAVVGLANFTKDTIRYRFRWSDENTWRKAELGPAKQIAHSRQIDGSPSAKAPPTLQVEVEGSQPQVIDASEYTGLNAPMFADSTQQIIYRQVSMAR